MAAPETPTAPGTAPAPTPGPGPRAEAVQRLQRWFRGYPYPPEPAGTALDVVAEKGSPVRDFLRSDLVNADTLVFAVDPDGETPGPARVVPVSGGVRDTPDELRLDDDIYVETFDYLSAPYLAVVGPAAIRVTSTADYRAFLEDADQAVAEGRFAGHLLIGNAQLADLPALGTDLPAPGLARLYLAADGQLRTAPDGPPLGSAGLASPASALDADLLATSRAARPWLSRYVLAVEALRTLGLAGPDLAVSGFRFRLTAGQPETPVERADRPLLVHGGVTGADRAGGAEGGVVVVTVPGFRAFRLGPGAGMLLEIMEAGAGSGPAAATAARTLGITAEAARTAYGRLLDRLGCPPPPVGAPEPAADAVHRANGAVGRAAFAAGGTR